MKEVTLQLTMSKKEIEHLISRYHFNDTDFSEMEHLYRTVSALICPKVFYELNPSLSFIEHDTSVISIVTLGNHIDSLQNLYSDAGRVSEAYMIECLSMELLNKAYTYVDRIIFEDTKQWVESYDFLGDKYPLDKIAEVIDYSGQMEVTYNAFFALQPKKTVIFVANVSDKYEKRNCSLCSTCKNKNCSSRKEEKEETPKNNLNYGYQKIFGKTH